MLNSLCLARVCTYCRSVEERPQVRQIDRPSNTCTLENGSTRTVPALLTQFLMPGDRLALQTERGDFASIERLNKDGGRIHFLYAQVLGWCAPTPTRSGGHVIRAARTPLLLVEECVTAYFYAAEPGTLYQSLGARQEASFAELRTAWRLRHIELTAPNTDAGERLRAERSFNILMNPCLRQCYDSMPCGDDIPLPMPYAGPAEILVEGSFSVNEGAFFGTRILSYRPETEKRTVSILLRTCEFLKDRVIFRDPRHKCEVWLDRTQLPGISWDLRWNHSKHWLQSRLKIEATFVRTSTPDGEVRLVALPSRTQVVLPDGIKTDIARAAEIQRSVSQNIDVLNRIRSELRSKPTEYVVVQQWLDHLGIRDVEPELAVWEPDYDPFYFQALRAHSSTCFLFRDEFLFVLPQAVISEIPKAGHATYTFARPTDLDSFLTLYSRFTREDVRANRHNAATHLGFIGRIVRGTDKARWKRNVMKVACGASSSS